MKQYLPYLAGFVAMVMTFVFFLVVVVDGFHAAHENNLKTIQISKECIEAGFHGWDGVTGCWK